MADESGLEMRAHLQMQLQTVAQRIVETARLAAAAHLFGSLASATERYGQRVAIGGAGPVSSVGSEDSRLPARPPRAGGVTDDAPPAPPPPASDYSFRRPRPRYTGAD